jgi:tripartite-type tricarboxylate transporter receptor subunit TctC
MMMKKRIAAAIAGLAAGICSAGASAQAAFPSQPLKIIVPFAPGGGSDFIGRFIADKLTKSLGQPVLVDNRPGAGGLLGIEIGVKAPADGYTFILIASSYAVNPSIFKLKFDPVADITPVAQISQGPMVLLANPGLKIKTVKELLERARAKPGEITFASAGLGSVTHMAGEYFASAAKIKLTHVPYKGTSPALTDTIAGQVNVFFSSPASALAHVESGKLVALGVTTTKRATGAVYAKVPPIAEAGLPGYEAVLWHGLIGPKGIPKAIVERMNTEIAAALKNKEAVEKLETDGVAPAGGSADQFAALIKKDIALWAKVVKDGNIKVE